MIRATFALIRAQLTEIRRSKTALFWMTAFPLGFLLLFGYVMAANLLWRLIWAFLGNRYARWHAMLPGLPGYGAAFRAYVVSLWSGEPEQYVGHNPLARIAVTPCAIATDAA